MGNLKRSLKEAVRKLAYNTSVDQLKKRGVKQVNVLGIDRVVGLIEEAVHRSLRHRLLAADREAVADATKEEFLRLLKTNEDLKRTHDELRRRQELADEEASALRLEIQRLQQELEERLATAAQQQRARYEGENAEIVDAVRMLFEDGGPGGDAMQDRVLALVMELVDRERRTSVVAEETAKNREVDLLQRRISKLTKSLEVTEQRLVEISALKDVDSGIASIYREVQGLTGNESQHKRKKELMSSIFKANLQLQKRG